MGKLFPEPFVIMNGKWNGYGPWSTISSTTRFKYCGHGCLYDIHSDPSEDIDLTVKDLGRFGPIRDKMKARLAELNVGLFKPNRGDADPAACKQIKTNGGFYGPWIDMPKISQ